MAFNVVAGNRKVLSIQKRIGKEVNFLSSVRVFTPINSDILEHNKIAQGKIKNLPSILAIAEKFPGIIFCDSENREIEISRIRDSIQTLQSCRKALYHVLVG